MNIELTHHIYVLRINKINISRAEFMNRLRDEGIITQVHLSLSHHPYYQRLGFN